MEANTNWRKIISFSLPMTIIGVFDLLLIWIDFFWIHLLISDANALAAVRLSASVMILIEALIGGVISALLVYMSQHIGSGALGEAKRAICACFAYALYAGMFVTILGVFSKSFLVQMFGVNAYTETYAGQYLGVFLLGYLTVLFNNILLTLPRYFQNLKLVYKGMGVSISINVFATPLMMWLSVQLGGSQIAGAAVGTIFANLCCALFLLYRILIKDSLKINLGKGDLSLKMDYSLLHRNRTYIGSQIFNNITYQLSAFLYILILSYYPSDAFNVYALASYIYIFFGLLAQNFAVSIIPLVSQYKGAGQIYEIQDLVKKILLVLVSYGAVIGGIIIAGRNVFAGILSTNVALEPVFADFFLIYTIPWIFSILSLVFIFVVSGSGDAKGSMTLTFVNMYVFAVLGLLLVPQLFTDRTAGVFYTLALIQLLTFVFSWTYYLIGRWKKASLVRQTSDHEEGIEITS